MKRAWECELITQEWEMGTGNWGRLNRKTIIRKKKIKQGGEDSPKTMNLLSAESAISRESYIPNVDERRSAAIFS